jgi:dTDP-4-dehydrorhamnose reductase
MKLLIFGASGFIGRHCYRLAGENGHDVFGTYSGHYQAGLTHFDILTDKIMNIIPPSFLSETSAIYAVVCSSISNINRCFSEKEPTRRLNVTRTIDLLKELASNNIKPVFVSSSNVFDGLKGYYDETDDVNPVNEYGRQKAAVEKFILENLPGALILRLSKVVGSRPDEKHPLAEWYHLIKQGTPIVCMDGLIWSPTYVEDVASGILKAVEKGLAGVYHLANPEIFTRYELAIQFSSALGHKAEIVSQPADSFNFLEEYPLKSYFDGAKFRNDTGQRFTSMSEVFRRFIANL